MKHLYDMTDYFLIADLNKKYLFFFISKENAMIYMQQQRKYMVCMKSRRKCVAF